MLYMGSVNRLIFWVLIPLTLIFYVTFRAFEWQSWDDGGRQLIAEQHAINLSNRDDVDCLILGGSNAVFGLSAEQISNESNLTCYNLSLANEGYSDDAYFNFIRNLPIERTEIKSVIYSSVYPLASQPFILRLEHNQNQTSIRGEIGFQLVGRSLASYMKNVLQGKPLFQYVQYPAPTSSGDFNFDEYDGCTSEELRDHWTPVTLDEDFKQWLGNNLMTVRNLFPNANISFVLPSKLGRNMGEVAFATFSDSLQSEVVMQSANYIEQSPFSDVSVLCDATHHGNSIGRTIRTSELLMLLDIDE